MSNAVLSICTKVILPLPFTLALTNEEKELLKYYVGRTITLGVRPENIVKGDDMTLSVTLNENLGQTTLVHGTIGGHKATAKFREWSNYKPGDEVTVSFDRKHFFDKDTTKAIR